MPSFEQGDMWLAGGTHFVTTNSTLRGHRLVMGAGAARQAAEQWPHLPDRFGAIVQYTCGHLGEYNVIYTPDLPCGAFQTKYHWSKPADHALIERSVEALVKLAVQIPGEIHLNFPGIGLGGLSIMAVAPLLKPLPVNVHIWQK